MSTAIADAPIKELNMSQIRDLVGEKTADEPEPVETTKPAEPEPEGEEEHTEAAAAPALDKPTEEVEEELPENVRKKIERESKKQAFFQSKIDHAVSARKAAEAEAAKITGTTGSEPAPNTEPAKDSRPPELPDLGTFPGTLEEFRAAQQKALADWQKWIEAQARETVSKELTERQTKEAMERAFEAAAEKHGKEFPSMMASLRDSTPPEFQLAVSKLDNWDTVAVHLAKDQAERDRMLNVLKSRGPEALLIQLGKLEDRLKPEANSVKEELPRPLKPVGGGARGTAPPFEMEKASYVETKRFLNKTLANRS